MIERVAEEMRAPVSQEPMEEPPETKLPADKESLLMENSLEISVPPDPTGATSAIPYVPDWATDFDPGKLAGYLPNSDIHN